MGPEDCPRVARRSVEFWIPPRFPSENVIKRKTVPEGIRITKVGLWYILLAVLVALPAANTGNNALYMVEACLLALLVVSGITSRQNLRRVDIELMPPGEVFARQPFSLRFAIEHAGWLWDRRLLLIAGVGEGKPELVAYLPRREKRQGMLELTANRRGRLQIPYLHLSSIYPLGLFRKGMRYRVDLEMLVYPQLLGSEEYRVQRGGPGAEHASRKPGSGPELLTLRAFRQGDDRRGIHWKQSARTGELIYMEREAEKGQRVSLLLDNGVGRLQTTEARERFERMISEAATAAHHFIEKGYEIELITRAEMIGYGHGPGHRRRILEALALLAPVEPASQPLIGSDPEAQGLEFSFREAAQ